MMNTTDNAADHASPLGCEKIPRLVLRFSSTTMAALLFNSLYNLTDTLFLSRGVGDNAMGGAAIVFPFIILQSAIATAVGGGAASIISRKLGSSKPDEAGEVTLNAMLTFYLSAVVITILGFIFMNPILRFMGVTDELYPLAQQYFIIILAGNIFSTGFSSIIRAEGKMLYGLLIWVIPISINIVLDAVFILLLGWGVRGAAAATVACQFTSFCMSMLFFFRFSCQHFKGARLKLSRIGEIFAIGIPSLVQMTSISIMSVMLNNALRDYGGTPGVTAYAYMSKIMLFLTVPFTAITQALAPIVGFNFGADHPERVKQTIRFCTMICFFYALFALLLAEALPTQFIRIFTEDAEITALGSYGLRIIAFAILFSPFPALAGATYQAIGQKTRALFMYAANMVFLIPSVYSMAGAWGITGIWWAYVAASAAAFLLALSLVYYTLRKNSKSAHFMQG